MKHVVSCTHKGCNFEVRAPDRDTAATWLYRHLVTAHDADMRTLSLENLKPLPRLEVADNGPDVGMPWAVKPKTREEQVTAGVWA